MSKHQITPQDYTILIVDDAPINIQVLGSALREHQFNFEYATNGTEALQKLELLDVDLVLLDIMMPQMDGFEVCQRIRKEEKYNDLPVIFLTAKADKESVIKGFEAGGQDYVIKPFDFHELIARVSIHLELRTKRLLLKDSNDRLEEKVKQRTVQLEKARERAEESDRLKSVFLANMSHEIRTPMNGILGFTGLLRESYITPEDRNEYISVIEDCGKHLLSIINNLVDISRVEAGLVNVTNEKVSLNQQLEESFRFFKAETDAKGLELSYALDERLLDDNLWLDGEKLYALFTNLIKNAVKFTQEGSISFGYELKGDDLQFFVQDTGIGIPEAQQSHIFQRFRQVDDSIEMLQEGNGLGLSIAKAYVEMMGGTIWVKSEEGVGTCFYFTLPLNYPPQ